MASDGFTRPPVDWSTCSYALNGGADLAAELESRTEELESIVEPFLADSRTGEIIAFRSKKRYLAADSGVKVMHAVLALQFAYALRDARRRGDVGRIIEMAMGFAHHDHEVSHVESWGVDSTHGILSGLRAIRGRKNRGRSALKTDEHRQLFLMVAEKHRSEKGTYPWKKIAAEMTSRHGIKIGEKAAKSNHDQLTKKAIGTNDQK